MPAYVYDDFEIALTARADGTYDLNAVTPDRSHFHTTFKVPPTAAELVEAAAGIARVRSRARHRAADGRADGDGGDHDAARLRRPTGW